MERPLLSFQASRKKSHALMYPCKRMNKWVFVVAGADPRALLAARLQAGLWPLRVQTPHRNSFAEGDEVVLYMGRPECAFAGTAKVASKTVRITNLLRNH